MVVFFTRLGSVTEIFLVCRRSGTDREVLAWKKRGPCPLALGRGAELLRKNGCRAGLQTQFFILTNNPGGDRCSCAATLVKELVWRSFRLRERPWL
ncbi:hypothetical protein AVEN_3119-1 [Araneus ventricosus]|uniref:Uncharacterized protein n=1 Tax=Araneus ventricosus TaxID=182803 RepID=A0A4Y2VLZ8_ARAVE|nr:hypothetical protein AVEN_3118-1 [Araneus ventricosus]GBO25448.1 hypothetical protein AVEN_3119-1 [Araneus ventricosus]